MENTIGTASREWATRPDDQRYLSLPELDAAVRARYRESWTSEVQAKDLRVTPSERGLVVTVPDRTHGPRTVRPTHWAFGQAASYAGAPASYLRKLPDELAAINLQYGLEHLTQNEGSLILGHSNGDDRMRALTSPKYGRIWDAEVVKAVMNMMPKS